MPTLLEICLEETALPPEAERYIRCVALPGGEPGLALDREGAVRWMPDTPAPYGLWVSADDQLILLRAQGARPITVTRAGRSLEAPAEMPVVLLDQDLLQIDGRELRVHVHGVADEIHAPERLSGSALARVARATAAALAMSAAVGVGGGAAAERAVAGPTPIEVRAQPPAPRRAPRQVTCDVTSTTTSGSGSTQVVARCATAPIPPVGSRGQLLDAKGAVIDQSSMVVTQVKGNTIIGDATLRKGVKATRVRFFIN
jgi:hypothetical protein